MSTRRSNHIQDRSKGAPPASRPSRSWRRWLPLGASLLASALALTLYLSTLAPTVTFADAGELASAVYFLDIAHPPGFPLYMLLAKGFSLLLPGVRFIRRLNAFSALCAAAAVGLTCAALVVELSPSLPSRSPSPRRRRSRKGRRRPHRGASSSEPTYPRWVTLLIALVAASLLATSRTFWEQATITEVYALNVALAAGLLLLSAHHHRAQRQGDRIQADRALAGAALLTGLGLGNHLTLLFIAAGLFLSAWLEEGSAFWHGPSRGRRLLLLTGLFALGMCIYLYLPFRALSDPPMNWGNPDSLGRFWRHVSGKQYQVNFAPSWPTWIAQWRFFLPRLGQEFSPLPLLLAPLGLYRLFRRRRALAWGTTLSAGLLLFYALSYDIAEDQETYYMLLFLLAVTWMAHGAAQLLDWLAIPRLKQFAPYIVAGLLPLLLLWPLLGHWPHCDRRHYTYAEAYARDVLDHLPTDAFVLTRDWNLFAPVYYLQQVEGVRPDATFVDQELLRRSWYLETLARRSPWLTRGSQPALSTYQKELAKFEQDLAYDFDTIQAAFQGLSNAFLETATAGGRPALLTPEVEYSYGHTVEERFLGQMMGQPPLGSDGVGEGHLWRPRALAFQLLTAPPEGPSWESFSQPALQDGRLHDPLTQQMIQKYARFWLHKGMYFHASGDCDSAVHAYEKALAIDWELELAHQGILDCRQRMQPQ